MRKAALRLFKKEKFSITPKMALQTEEPKPSEVEPISKDQFNEEPEEQGVLLNFQIGAAEEGPREETHLGENLWNKEKEEESKDMFYDVDIEMGEMYKQAESLLVPHEEK